MVLLKLEVIFKFRDLDDLGQVAAFKSTLKNEGTITRAFKVVVVLELVIIFAVDVAAHPSLILILRLAARADRLR